MLPGHSIDLLRGSKALRQNRNLHTYMQSTVKHLKGYCDGEHEQLTLNLISSGERELTKN